MLKHTNTYATICKHLLDTHTLADTRLRAIAVQAAQSSNVVRVERAIHVYDSAIFRTAKRLASNREGAHKSESAANLLHRFTRLHGIRDSLIARYGMLSVL